MNTSASRRTVIVLFLVAAGLVWPALVAPSAAAELASTELVGAVARALEPEVGSQIGLTQDQKAKLLEFIEGREQEALELARSTKNVAPSDRAQKLAEFRAASEAKAKAAGLLSDAQWEKLAQVREKAAAAPVGPDGSTPGGERRGKRPEGFFGPMGKPMGKMPEGFPGKRPEAAPGKAAEPSAGPPSGKPAAPAVEKSGPGLVELPPKPEGPPPKPEGPPPKPGKLRFNFRYQPWKDVLDWFAGQADLSLVADSVPPGTFNYTDAREYDPAEALDLLNSVLLYKGYTLVRRERMLLLVNVEDLKDGIPQNLVATITPEELDKRGEYELVSVVFQLEKFTPEEVEQEIRKLIGPQMSIVVLPKARQIQVTETAGRLRAIRRAIQSMENPTGATGQVQTYQFKHVDVQQALLLLRQLLDLPVDRNAVADGSVRFAVEPGSQKLLITGRPDAVARVQQMLITIDVADAASPGGRLDDVLQLEVYPITTADPNSVLQILQTLLSDAPNIRLAIDPKTGNLIAQARPAQHATIRATLEQLQQDAHRLEVIQLRVVDPQMAVLSINRIFAETPTTAPKVDADPVSRQLLVRGTEAQLVQIRTMLEKLGEPAAGSTGGNVRMIPLTGPQGAHGARATSRDLAEAAREPDPRGHSLVGHPHPQSRGCFAHLRGRLSRGLRFDRTAIDPHGPRSSLGRFSPRCDAGAEAEQHPAVVRSCGPRTNGSSADRCAAGFSRSWRPPTAARRAGSAARPRAAKQNRGRRTALDPFGSDRLRFRSGFAQRA